MEKYHNPLVAEGELKSGVEKYHNPLVAEGESLSHMSKRSNNIFKFISIVNDCRNEISKNSHAEI